jgi:hypothetical protein
MLFAISTCNKVSKRTAWILIRLRGCTGWSGSMLVANPLFWFCHDTAQILLILLIEDAENVILRVHLNQHITNRSYTVQVIFYYIF